jgi:ribonuclease H2 subunit B
MEYISVIKDGEHAHGYCLEVLMTDVDIETEHRYLRLPHPRTGQPQLYLSYTTASETQQILEVVKINCSQRRTWFIGESGIDSMSYPLAFFIHVLK